MPFRGEVRRGGVDGFAVLVRGVAFGLRERRVKGDRVDGGWRGGVPGASAGSSQKRPRRTEIPVFSLRESPRSKYLNNSPALKPPSALFACLHALQLAHSQHGDNGVNRDWLAPDWPSHFSFPVSVFKRDRSKPPAFRGSRKQGQRFDGQTVRPSHRLDRIPGRVLGPKRMWAVISRIPAQ